MNEIKNWQRMERLYRERAKEDPANSMKWLSQAERWRELGTTRRQMHAGPMQMGPTPVDGNLAKQQG